jgi:hypothetical protein
METSTLTNQTSTSDFTGKGNTLLKSTDRTKSRVNTAGFSFKQGLALPAYLLFSMMMMLMLSWDNGVWGQTTETLTPTENVNSPWIVPSGVTSITVKLWGAGGGSGGHGTTTGTPAVTAGGTGGATTFSGPGADLSAGGGAGSAGATDNTPTAGGVGGSATGGDIDINGSPGSEGSVSAQSGSTSATATGGTGGFSPNGGAAKLGASQTGNAGNGAAGVNGNEPGGGAGGSAHSRNQENNLRATGGGGGGAYSEITISVTPGQGFDFAVGAGGAAGTGDQAAGGAGADGEIEITYTEAACIPPLAPTSGGDQSECAGDPVQTLTAAASAPAGASVVWYNQAEGGSIVSEPTLSAAGTVTYYAESQSDDDETCVSETRTAVTLTLVAVPLIDDPDNVMACVSYILPALTVGGAYYESSGGVDPIAVGTEITSTRTIYVYAETGTTPNCWAENSFLVTINTSPVLELTKTDVICYGESSGSIDADWSGGADPYKIYLDGVERSSGLGSGPYEITGLTAGSYTVKVEDANGCFDEKTVQITQPDQLVAGTLSSSQEICWGEVPEMLTATTPAGGSHSDNLSYLWQYKFAFLSPEDDWTGDGNITTPLEYDFGYTDAPTQTMHYRLKITDTNCDSPQIVYTNEITITVNPLPNAPSSDNVTVTFDGNEHEAGATVETGEEVIWFADETGSTSAAAPKATNAGTYTAWAASRNITTGCISATRTEVTLVINKKAITVEISGNPTKFYDGSSTATLEAGDYSIGGLEGSDMVNVLQTEGTYASANAGVSLVTVSLVEADFEAIGSTLLSNYILPTSAEGNGTITPLTINVTADSKSKTYGETDPALTYQHTPDLIGEDEFTGELSRETGENVGTYAIGIGTLSAGANYSISFTSNDFAITPKTLTVVATTRQEKIYGAADPTFEYTATGFEFDDDEDLFTGALDRVPGEDVGNYAINIGTLSAGNNYSISFTSNNFSIAKKPLAVVATEGQSKIYGAADPIFEYTATGFEFDDENDENLFSGALSRAKGQDVGDYAILIGTLSAGNNYSIIFISRTFAITKKTLAVTATAGQSKVYGDADPVFAYSASGFEFEDDEDLFTGALSRDAGETVADYAIRIGDLSAGINYSIDLTSNDFAITPKTLTVVATTRQEKIYGAADPTFEYTATGFEFDDDEDLFTGALDRVPGEDVGNYAINIGTLSAGNNYSISFTSNNFSIAKKPLAVVATEGQSKIYGAADPIFEYTATGFEFDDENDENLFSGALSRAKGQDVGDYAILIGTLSAGNNYSIIFISRTFAITKKTLAVTATAGQSKVYGDADPVFAYSASGFEFEDDEDLFTGALSRDAGETVADYAIRIGDLSAGINYSIDLTSNDFAITQLAVTVTVDPDQSKTYGDVDPVFTYTSDPAVGFELANG